MSIEKTVENAIHDSIREALCARFARPYDDNPLNKLADEVIRKHAAKLTALMDEAFQTALDAKGFKQVLMDAYEHKLARVLVSKFEGEIEKRANDREEDCAIRTQFKAWNDARVRARPIR